jgi:hypothetical protein
MVPVQRAVAVPAEVVVVAVIVVVLVARALPLGFV